MHFPAAEMPARAPGQAVVYELIIYSTVKCRTSARAGNLERVAGRSEWTKMTRTISYNLIPINFLHRSIVANGNITAKEPRRLCAIRQM